MIGAIAGVVVPLGVDFLEHLRIDDPIGAVPVHLACGIWGTLAIGLFASGQYGFAGPDGPDNSMMTMFDSIIREMFVILIRLPYLSLLQESLKKQSQPKDKPADVRTLSICSPMAT